MCTCSWLGSELLQRLSVLAVLAENRLDLTIPRPEQGVRSIYSWNRPIVGKVGATQSVPLG